MRPTRDESTTIDGRVDGRSYAGRYRRFAILLTIPFVLLVMRLWYLQVWQADHYEQQAFSNVIDRTPIPAERGLIFDSQGRVIAENRPSYNVTLKPAFFAPHAITPDALDERMRLLKRVLALTEEEADALRARIDGIRSAVDRYQPLLVKHRITRDQVAVIESNRVLLPGVDVQAVSMRHYPFDDLAVHILGYVGDAFDSNRIERDPEYLPMLRTLGYMPGEMTGRSGIERAFEATLRGSPGMHATVVNSQRIPQDDADSRALLGDWRDVPPVPGKNLVLTVDMDLQRIMQEAMRDYPSGAAVAIDPRDGRVMGIMSKPTFNPNSWSNRLLSADEARSVHTNPHKPMINKALLTYFPGSTYKIVTALAALEMGLISPVETLHCPGFYEFGRRNRRFHCWKRGGHQDVDLVDSLMGSCDVYYYKLGEKIGMNKLADYAREFGFGERTGLGIGAEQAGLVPSREWHDANSSEGWQAGFTLSTAIGQGDTRVSPLQLALAFAALANGGTLFYPLIVDRVETADGHILFEFPVREHRRLDVEPENIRQIVRGLERVVNAEVGTAYAHRLDYVRVAGKTGTAQVTSRRTRNQDVEWHQRDHAWFAAFAPVEDPEIVVVVFLEHGGGGSSDAAPVAMEILDRYFRELRHVDPLQARHERPEPQYLQPRHPRDGDARPARVISSEPAWDPDAVTSP